MPKILLNCQALILYIFTVQLEDKIRLYIYTHEVFRASEVLIRYLYEIKLK